MKAYVQLTRNGMPVYVWIEADSPERFDALVANYEKNGFTAAPVQPPAPATGFGDQAYQPQPRQFTGRKHENGEMLKVSKFEPGKESSKANPGKTNNFWRLWFEPVNGEDIIPVKLYPRRYMTNKASFAPVLRLGSPQASPGERQAAENTYAEMSYKNVGDRSYPEINRVFFGDENMASGSVAQASANPGPGDPNWLDKPATPVDSIGGDDLPF